MMTLADFRDDLDLVLGERGTESSRLDRWINHAYFDVTGSINFEVLTQEMEEETIPGVYAYSLPGTVEIVEIIRDETNDRLLDWVHKVDFHRRSNADVGQPKLWTRTGNRFLIHPTPGDELDLLVLVREAPEELTDDGDTTVLPEMWDSVIFYLATQHAFTVLGEEQRGLVWMQKAITYLQTRLTEDILHEQVIGSISADEVIPRVTRATNEQG